MNRVYISGPITKGDRVENVAQAFRAQQECMRLGLAPFNPVASCCYPFAWDGEFSHDDWIKADLPWVEAANVVWRLPGDSAGAAAEVGWAIEKGIPVVYSLNELAEWQGKAEA